MYCLRGLRDWGIRAISLLLDEVLREHELVLLASRYHPISSVKVAERHGAALLGFEGHVTFSGLPFFADFDQDGGHQS